MKEKFIQGFEEINLQEATHHDFGKKCIKYQKNSSENYLEASHGDDENNKKVESPSFIQRNSKAVSEYLIINSI